MANANEKHDGTVRAHRLIYVGLLAALLAMAVCFPLYQLIAAGGSLYYTNGFDETTYLQYDFSRAVQALTRPGQYLVTLGHTVGLSGGWLNLLMDAGAIVAFPLLASALFRRLGWSPSQAHLGALMLVTLPMLTLGSNPAVRALTAWNVRSGAIFWLNTPEAYASPLLRSPEPQFSLLLLAAATLLALRGRFFWPVYGVLPFMYPFVAVPAAFVTLACHLRSRWPGARLATVGPLAASFLAIATAAWGYYTFLIGEKIRVLLVDSHLPLVSFTGVVALGAYMALRRRIDERMRFFALAVALAPLAASNQQLVSGHIAQPDNYEQYVGCFAVAIVIALAAKLRTRWRLALAALGLVFFGYSSYVVFKTNQANTALLPMSPALSAALREDPGHTVVNDVVLTSMLGLVHPRQGSTALAFDKTFTALADRYVPEYRCVKRQALAEHPQDARLRHAFEFLDGAYTYGSQNFIMAHINRKATFKVLQNVSPDACSSPEKRPLRYFLIP